MRVMSAGQHFLGGVIRWAPSQHIFASWSPFSINPATGPGWRQQIENLPQLAELPLPEIAEAIDLDLLNH